MNFVKKIVNEYWHTWYNSCVREFHGYPRWSFDFFFFGLHGLLLGFLVRVLGKAAVAVAAGACLVLFLFHVTGDVDINSLSWVQYAHEMYAASSEILLQYIKTYPAGMMGLLVGFIIGWRLGS